MTVFKNARLVGRLGTGPRLVADRANVVLTHRPTPKENIISFFNNLGMQTNTLQLYGEPRRCDQHIGHLLSIEATLSHRPCRINACARMGRVQRQRVARSDRLHSLLSDCCDVQS